MTATETASENTRRVGIMGGTFDPIHYGHLLLAEDAREAFHLDEIRFIPSGHSYFKDSRQDGVSAREDRLRMTELAVRDNPYFTVSDMEIRRSGCTYTCETMEQLRGEEPDTVFFFLCGADSLVQMSSWYQPARLFAACSILAAVRGDETASGSLLSAAQQLREKYSARIAFLPAREIQISSTEIRERIRDGRSVRYLVPDSVAAYIAEHGLYRA